MSDDISFSEPEKKPAPLVPDASMQELRKASILKLEKAQSDKQVRSEAGIDEIPKPAESIPKELPKMVFKFGSKVIGCDRFNIDDDEAKVLARHLSILTGSISSKVFSVIVILLVVMSKIYDCMDRVKEMIHGKKEEQSASLEKSKVDPAPAPAPVYGKEV